jgi:hypothetical protein
VLFGFWRGARLRALEPRLKPGGKYEMATLDIRRATVIDVQSMKRLVRAAVTLNREERSHGGCGVAQLRYPSTSRPATQAGAD